MTPFDPKTDSKEFEVASSELTVRENGSGATPPADVTIRLWRQDQAGTSSGLTWNSESVLVYMIADLVAASYGRTTPGSSGAMAAHFGNASQAIVAAKRIQLAILEFVACKPGDYLGAALLIHPTVSAGFSSGMAQSALRLAEPGQVILSDAITRSLQNRAGIELRPVAALTTGGTEHTGLSEFVWASPEQIAKLRECARARPTGVSAGPTMGATMMVNSPPAPRSVAAPDSAEASARNVPNPADGRLTHSRDGAFEEGLAEFQEHRSFITRTRVIIGVVAILLIGVAVALFYPSGGSKVPQRPPEKQVGETPTTPVLSTEPVSPQPPPPVQSAADAHAKVRPPVSKQPVSKQPVQKAADQGQQPAKKVEDSPIQGFEGISTYDGMTQKDIPRLLQWARSDAGNGRYEKAGQEYRVILQLQPNNPDAKEGLRKLQLAQQREQ